jgi:homogentisate 1,2-dioxygenase
MSQQKNISSGFGWAQGEFSSQPHVAVPKGTFEEEHGRQGFFGKASHLYHRHPPTGWLRIEGPLKPRAYFAAKAEELPFAQSRILLQNADVQVGIATLKKTQNVFIRNADADELRFVDSGAGILQTDYGDLHFEAGHYLLIPRGTTYRFVCNEPGMQFVIESATEIELPDKGILGRHAFFDPMVMKIPQLEPSVRTDGANDAGEFEVHVKRQAQWTKIFYPWNPLDAIGWKGDLVPWALHYKDLRPVTSERVLLPPSAYTTFVAKNFIVCTFVPRPAIKDTEAEKVPFYHRNIEYDEILFHHHGRFSKRTDIGAGRIVWHPQGVHHGPHPTSAANACKLTIEEVAIMVDTYHPLQATQAGEQLEDPSYAMSWAADQGR